MDHIGSGDIERVTRVLTDWRGDAYVRMTTTNSPGGTRGRAEDAAALCAAWSDIDGAWGEHKNKDGLARHPDEVRDWAANCDLPPNILVNSGGGFYGFWLVDPWALTKETVPQAAQFMQDFQAHLRRVAPFAIDATHDLARVLRVPGTINFKAEPRPVVWEATNQTLYTVELLWDAARSSAPASTRSAKTVATDVEGVQPDVIPPWLNDVVTQPVPQGQRSEAFHALVGHCKRDGFMLEEAVWLCEQVPWVVDKFAGRIGGEVGRSWEKLGDVDETTPSTVWSVPLTIEPSEPPELPVYAFPVPLRDPIEAVAHYTGAPIDLAAVAALGVISAVATGRLEVHGSWREPANLYVCAVAAPGVRKTPVWQALSRPLRRVERDLQSRWQEGADLRAARLRLNEREQTRVQQAKDLSADEAAEQLAQLQREARDLDVPIPRLLLEDATPEALVSEQHRQDGRITLWSDEGGAVFSQAQGRYSKDPFVEPYLKGFSVIEPLTVTRQNGRHTHIPRPAVTVCIAVQPSVLTGLAADNPLVTRGLLSRFLFAYPRVDFDDIDVTPRSEPTSVLDAFDGLITRICAGLDEHAAADPAPLFLSPDALDTFTDFRAEVAHVTALRVRTNGESDAFLLALNKFAGQALRIAGLLHLVEHPALTAADREISATTMQSAVEVARYFMHHAKRIAPSTGGAARLPIALATWKVILERLVAHVDEAFLDVWTFRQRDVMRAMSTFATVAELEPVLRTLEEMGFIAPCTTLLGKPRPGRPAKEWAVNPMVIRWVKRHLEEGLPAEWSREAIADIAAHEPEAPTSGARLAVDEDQASTYDENDTDLPIVPVDAIQEQQTDDVANDVAE